MAGMGGGGFPEDGTAIAEVKQVEPDKVYNFVRIAKGYDVQGFALKDRKIVSINFSHGSSSYIAKISLDFIALFDGTDNSCIAEHDSATGYTSWYLNHRCSDPEFGDGENVRCIACNVGDSKIQDRMWNRGILNENGRHYSKDLSDVLKKGITEYIGNFYEFCKK